ncbi:MAG: DNA mismatch repair endonuclease MutL [Eubacterium sp.]
MNKIQVLDQKTINQIAAGEVIDRPSSIVKELMENAIDAGANMISVEIEDGGMSLIRITDNGCGIEKDDIKIAFLRHSTSKIKSALDLLSISSLGFRGEALSSIAAVCQVEMITKTAGNITGIRYKIEGGKEITFEEIGAPEGTTFIVRNIFFNTPARRKFLKAAQTEAGYISDIIERIALSHPEISINFVNNNQTKIHTSGNGSLKDVIYSIYGRDITNNLLEINFKNEFMSMSGFIGKAIISKGNRSLENYFINGRYIKSNIISKAIEDGYKLILMQHKYPFTAINFEIDQELLDVNVHPAKMELRFRRSEAIYPFIVENIHQALTEKPNIVKVELEKPKEEPKKKISAPEPFEVNRNHLNHVLGDTDYNGTSNKTVENTKVNGCENGIKESLKAAPDYISSVDTISQPDKIQETTEYISDASNTAPTPNNSNDISGTQQELTAVFDDFLSDHARPKHKLIGQVFDTYWVIEYEDKMYIIDQHAAHEKVMFELLMDKLENKEISSQMINPPIILNLSMNESALLDKYMDNFREIGFEIEAFGGQDYAVRAVPSDLYTLDSYDVLMDIIDNLSMENGRMVPDIITEKIASMSCKAAVKGNNRLSTAEANALIDQLLSLDNPYNCPHGRPTIISMSKYELEKKFKRII